MKSLLFFLLLTITYPGVFFCAAQKASALKVQKYEEYLAVSQKDQKKVLIELKKAIPSLKLDIRYATKNNFMHQVMYKQARAFARKEVALQLQKIQAALYKKGYGLKVFDGYRPYTITVAFYQKASDKNFVANPSTGSIHNRGCAVDLTLTDLKTGKDLVMPTPYDSFSAAAAANYQQATPLAIKNRTFLINMMERYGFKVRDNEWWHFDYKGWENYELLDIPFEQL
jgi:D-alanyl-D-alanine dipeptidase